MNTRLHNRATPARYMLSALDVGRESVTMEDLGRPYDQAGWIDANAPTDEWSMAYHARAHALGQAAIGDPNLDGHA